MRRPGAPISGRRAATGAWLTLAALIACSSRSAEQHDPPEAAEQQAHQPAKGAPPELDALESFSEDAFDLALAGDRVGVDRMARHIASGWQQYRPQAVRDGAPDQLVVELDAAVAELVQAAAPGKATPVGLARAANRVNGAIAGLFALYRGALPAGLMRLGYLGREMMLDAEQEDFVAARLHFSAIEDTWGGLIPRVRHAGGETQIARYDETIRSMRRAIDESDARHLFVVAERGLDVVDDIRDVLRPPSGHGGG